MHRWVTPLQGAGAGKGSCKQPPGPHYTLATTQFQHQQLILQVGCLPQPVNIPPSYNMPGAHRLPDPMLKPYMHPDISCGYVARQAGVLTLRRAAATSTRGVLRGGAYRHYASLQTARSPLGHVRGVELSQRHQKKRCSVCKTLTAPRIEAITLSPRHWGDWQVCSALVHLHEWWCEYMGSRMVGCHLAHASHRAVLGPPHRMLALLGSHATRANIQVIVQTCPQHAPAYHWLSIPTTYGGQREYSPNEQKYMSPGAKNSSWGPIAVPRLVFKGHNNAQHVYQSSGKDVHA